MVKRDRVAQSIVKHVELNWKQGVTVKEVAGRFDVDPSDANRIFRSVVGSPIAHYVQEK